MTWFARKIVIFDMFKDVEALGEKQKNSGEKPSKSLEIFPAPPPPRVFIALLHSDVWHIIMKRSLEYTLKLL